jgi:hypothetical protein
VWAGINGWFSTCEQAGLQIVKQLLVEKKHDIESMESPYSIGQLQCLRRCDSSIEIDAYVWITGSYLQCVSGAAADSTSREFPRLQMLKQENTWSPLPTRHLHCLSMKTTLDARRRKMIQSVLYDGSERSETSTC